MRLEERDTKVRSTFPPNTTKGSGVRMVEGCGKPFQMYLPQTAAKLTNCRQSVRSMVSAIRSLPHLALLNTKWRIDAPPFTRTTNWSTIYFTHRRYVLRAGGLLSDTYCESFHQSSCFAAACRTSHHAFPSSLCRVQTSDVEVALSSSSKFHLEVLLLGSC